MPNPVKHVEYACSPMDFLAWLGVFDLVVRPRVDLRIAETKALLLGGEKCEGQVSTPNF